VLVAVWPEVSLFSKGSNVCGAPVTSVTSPSTKPDLLLLCATFGGWQIEEGEVDTERGRQFSSCFRKSHKKEQDAKLAEERKQRAAAKTTK